MFICTFGKRKPNPTNESVARFNANHPSIHPKASSSISPVARDERTRWTRREKEKSYKSRAHHPPSRAIARPPRSPRARTRARPRAVLSTRIADPPTNARNEWERHRDAERDATRAQNDGWDARNRNRSMHPSFFTPRPPVAGRRPSSVGRRSTADPWCARGSFRHKTASHDASNAMGLGHENKRRCTNETRTVRAMMNACERVTIGFFISRGYNMGSIRFDR